MADKTPETASASIYVPRGNFSCLLLLQEALQDQQVCLPHTSFKMLLLPWILEQVTLCVSPLREESLLQPSASPESKPLWPLKSSILGLVFLI